MNTNIDETINQNLTITLNYKKEYLNLEHKTEIKTAKIQ